MTVYILCNEIFLVLKKKRHTSVKTGKGHEKYGWLFGKEERQARITWLIGQGGEKSLDIPEE